MLFRVMNPHQRCLQAKVKYRNQPKQVMPKSEDLSRSLEIKPSLKSCELMMNLLCTNTFMNKTILRKGRLGNSA